MKTVFSNMKETVEIRTKELAALKAENQLQNDKIKELSYDNSLYMKKIMKMESEMFEKMNAANQLYEEAKTLRTESILKSNNEDGIAKEGVNFGIDPSMLNDNYFSVPSTTRHKIFAHSKEAMSLTYTMQGTAIASGGGDGTIKIWDVEKGKEIGSLNKQKKAITSLKFSPDDQYLATCSLDRNIKLWKISTLREATSFTGHSDTINACSFSYAAK